MVVEVRLLSLLSEPLQWTHDTMRRIVVWSHPVPVRGNLLASTYLVFPAPNYWELEKNGACFFEGPLCPRSLTMCGLSRLRLVGAVPPALSLHT